MAAESRAASPELVASLSSLASPPAPIRASMKTASLDTPSARRGRVGRRRIGEVGGVETGRLEDQRRGCGSNYDSRRLGGWSRFRDGEQASLRR